MLEGKPGEQFPPDAFGAIASDSEDDEVDRIGFGRVNFE